MEKTKTSYAGSVGSFGTRTTQRLNPSTPQPLLIIPSQYHKRPPSLPPDPTNLPISQPLNPSTPQPLVFPISFPLKQSLHKTLSENLNRLHSDSQNLYHSRLITPLLSFSRSKSLIQYKDILFSIAPSIDMTLYPPSTSIRRLSQFTEYYRYHKDIPKMFVSPVNFPLFAYYDSQRRLAYETLSNKLYFSKSYKHIDKTPARSYEQILPQKPDFCDNLSMVTIRELREALSTPLAARETNVQYQSDHSVTKRDLFTRKHHPNHRVENREYRDLEIHIDNRDHREGDRYSVAEKAERGVYDHDTRDYCYRLKKQRSGKLLSTIDESTKQNLVNLFLKNRLKSIDKAPQASTRPPLNAKKPNNQSPSHREKGFISSAATGVNLGLKRSFSKAGRPSSISIQSKGGYREPLGPKNQKKPGVFLRSRPKIYQSMPHNVLKPPVEKLKLGGPLFAPSMLPLESQRALSDFKLSVASHRPLRESDRGKISGFGAENPPMSSRGPALASAKKRPASINQPSFASFYRANSFGKSQVLSLSKRSSVY